MYDVNNLNITKGLNKGVFLPKTLFNPYYSSSSSYRNQSLNLNQRGGNKNTVYNNNIQQVDYGLLFNLGVFTLFVCSLFYICVYRYRNKQKLKKEQELKQKKRENKKGIISINKANSKK